MNRDKHESLSRIPGGKISEEDSAFLKHVMHTEDEPSDLIDEFPIVAVPETLHTRLYSIPDMQDRKKRRTYTLSGLASAAALIIAAVLSTEFYVSHPTDEEILRAKEELAVAFGYLNAANRKANAHTVHTLNVNLQRASVKSVFNVVAKEKESL